MNLPYYDKEKLPICFEEFVPDSLCDDLVSFLENNNNLFEGENSIDYWKNRIINALNLDEPLRSELIRISTLTFHMVNRASLHKWLCVPDTLDIVRWEKGASLTPHIDNAELDGSSNYTPWRHFSTMIYLNDDFKGGDIYWPNLNKTVKPRKGMMIVFPSDAVFLHGVTEIEEGTRYTISSFYTYDSSKALNVMSTGV
jgi:hypothetical protein